MLNQRIRFTVPQKVDLAEMDIFVKKIDLRVINQDLSFMMLESADGVHVLAQMYLMGNTDTSVDGRLKVVLLPDVKIDELTEEKFLKEFLFLSKSEMSQHVAAIDTDNIEPFMDKKE